MSCKCNTCQDPFTLPVGLKGDTGNTGDRGTTGSAGTSVANNGGMIYSNYGPQGLVAATEAAYTNHSFSIPAGTLATDGDTLVLNAMWSKYTSTGTGAVYFYFNGNKVSFDSGAVGGDPGESTLKFELTITRVSNTEVVVVAKSTEYGSAVLASIGDDISVGANVSGSNLNLQFLKRTTISSLNLTTTAYVIEPRNISAGTGDAQYLEYTTIEKIEKV